MTAPSANIPGIHTPQAAAPRPGQLRAFLYARTSKDKHRRGRSTKRQMEENRAACEEMGYYNAGEYVDIDRSASSRAKKDREHYARMVADIEAGGCDILVYCEAARANRDLEKYIQIRNLCMANNVLWYYGGTVYDLSKTSDKNTTARHALQAEEEADAIAERCLRGARSNARRGGPHGQIPFGFVRRYDEESGELAGQFPHPEHAAAVADFFTAVDSGMSINSAADIVRRHWPDVSRTAFLHMLRNKAYIGIRTHHGQETKGTWEPIVAEDVFWRVQRILADPRRRTAKDNRVLHLMSGIAECGPCSADPGVEDAGLSIALARGRRYRCRPAGHVGINADLLDAHIEQAVLSWLKSPQAAAAFERPDGGEREAAVARLEMLRAQLREAQALAVDFDEVTGAPKLSAASLAQMEQKLTPLITRAEARVEELTAVGDTVVDGLLAADDVEAAWKDLVIEQRRRALRAVVRVRVHRASRQGVHHLEPGRVEMAFRGDPAFDAWYERSAVGAGAALRGGGAAGVEEDEVGAVSVG